MRQDLLVLVVALVILTVVIVLIVLGIEGGGSNRTSEVPGEWLVAALDRAG
jgi:hypothetical protein